ncbi:MAG: extracellular solute-binding protein [Bacilli bacterium]|jgi:multiple sugar transport system substrate-binding protein
MKKIRSRFPSLVVAALFATMALVGCDGGTEEEYNGDPTQLKTSITFWHTMGAANRAVLDSMIAEFNTIFPKITIEHASQGGYPEIRDKISSAIPAGTTPTMAYCYPDHVADYMNAGAVQDLTTYIGDEVLGLGVEGDLTLAGGVDDFIPAYWQEGQEYVKEGVYSVPFSKSTEVLFYNKDFFTTNSLTVPTTWEEMITVARQIKVIDPASIPFGYDSDANWFITLCEQMNIPYTSIDPDNHFLFDNPEARAVVQDLKNWFDEGLITTQGSSPNNAYTSTQFTEGKLYMTVGSTGGTRYDFSPNFEVGVAPVPQYKNPDTQATSQKVISQGPSITIFKRATANQKIAAWLFYKWITNTRNSAIYSVLTGYNPVRSSSFLTSEYTTGRSVTPGTDSELIKAVADFVPFIEDWYYVSPAFKGSSTARDEVDGILANVLLGLKTIDEAFDDAITACVFAT